MEGQTEMRLLSQTSENYQYSCELFNKCILVYTAPHFKFHSKIAPIKRFKKYKHKWGKNLLKFDVKNHFQNSKLLKCLT